MDSVEPHDGDGPRITIDFNANALESGPLAKR